MPGTDRAGMDGALQAVNGLALVEKVKDFVAEFWIAEVVAQIDRSQQLAEPSSRHEHTQPAQ